MADNPKHHEVTCSSSIDETVTVHTDWQTGDWTALYTANSPRPPSRQLVSDWTAVCLLRLTQSLFDFESHSRSLPLSAHGSLAIASSVSLRQFIPKSKLLPTRSINRGYRASPVAIYNVGFCVFLFHCSMKLKRAQRFAVTIFIKQIGKGLIHNKYHFV